jgi:hypothetical protein
MRNIAGETLVNTNDGTAATTRREIAVAASLINQSYTRPAQCVVIRKTSGGTTMKTLYALVAVCMSSYAFTASADRPALMADEYSNYISSIGNHDVREALAARGTTPDADVATDPATDNSFAVNPDADDYTAAEVIPGINTIPQSDDDLTGSLAEPRAGETE